MKKISVLSAVVFIWVCTSGFAMAAEPTEKEMLSALQGGWGQVGQQANGMSEQCKYIRERNDPLAALACVFGGIQQEVHRSISITGFEKVGCGKARAAGYVCDYRIKLSGPMLPNTWSPIETKRFIQTQGRWVTAG
ncbi:MAG TPA: hypothetical protein PKN72_08895 [Nitrosomonas europaea]|nr:hypothetical protein [Nitrosomonas europaea]